MEIANLIYTIAFAMEMVIKMYGLGLINYVRDRFNIFDCTIVMLSLIDIIFN